jgi:hypothetical protein
LHIGRMPTSNMGLRSELELSPPTLNVIAL